MTIASMLLVGAGIVVAAQEDASLDAPPSPPNLEDQDASQSLGGQAGEAARELKETAGANYAVASAKVAETSQKVEAEAKDAFQSLREQWDALSKQVQESAKQLSGQVQKQWEDFNKSFNQSQK